MQGDEPIPKGLQPDCSDHFNQKGFYIVRPYLDREADYKRIVKFFLSQKTFFDLDVKDFKDAYSVYYTQGREDIVFAASFIMFEINRDIVVYISLMKT